MNGSVNASPHHNINKLINVTVCVTVASQSSTSDTFGYDKKIPMTSVSSSTAADEKSCKDASQAPLGR